LIVYILNQSLMMSLWGRNMCLIGNCVLLHLI